MHAVLGAASGAFLPALLPFLAVHGQRRIRDMPRLRDHHIVPAAGGCAYAERPASRDAEALPVHDRSAGRVLLPSSWTAPGSP
jgi:hypothetical protein